MPGSDIKVETERVMGMIRSVWGSLLMPESVTCFGDLESIDFARTLHQRRYDDLIWDKSPLSCENFFLSGTPEANSYYLGGYLLYGCEQAQGDPDYFNVTMPIIYLHGFLEGSPVYAKTYRLLLEDRKQLVPPLCAYLGMCGNYADILGLDPEAINRSRAKWLEPSAHLPL